MFLSELAHKRLEGWNEKVLNEDAGLHYCRQNKICVVDDRREEYGRIVFYKGYAFILINPKLELAMRTWVLFHEIGHFILHSPHSSKFCPLLKRKSDREANYVAAVAMMPKAAIEGKTFAEIQEEFGYPDELITIRDLICKNEGI